MHWGGEDEKLSVVNCDTFVTAPPTNTSSKSVQSSWLTSQSRWPPTVGCTAFSSPNNLPLLPRCKCPVSEEKACQPLLCQSHSDTHGGRAAKLSSDPGAASVRVGVVDTAVREAGGVNGGPTNCSVRCAADGHLGLKGGHVLTRRSIGKHQAASMRVRACVCAHWGFPLSFFSGRGSWGGGGQKGEGRRVFPCSRTSSKGREAATAAGVAVTSHPTTPLPLFP